MKADDYMFIQYIEGNVTSYLEELEVNTSKIYAKNPPHICSECGNNKFHLVEVIGEEKTMFWDCDICDKMYLTEPKATTEKALQEAAKTYTNPNDFGAPSYNDIVVEWN